MTPKKPTMAIFCAAVSEMRDSQRVRRMTSSWKAAQAAADWEKRVDEHLKTLGY